MNDILFWARPTAYLWFLFVLAGCASSGGGYLRPDTAAPEPEAITRIDLPKAKLGRQKEGDEYYDPNRERVGLFDTHNLGTNKLGPYFMVSDFAKSGDQHFRYARIDPKLVTCLNKVRAALNRPIAVNSSYRTWGHNEKLRQSGKQASSKSYHLSGRAADVSTNAGVSLFAKTVYGECGCKVGLGVANSFYHVDVRGSQIKPWGYGRGIADIRLAAARSARSSVCGGGGAIDTNELSATFLDNASKAKDASISIFDKTKKKVKEMIDNISN